MGLGSLPPAPDLTSPQSSTVCWAPYPRLISPPAARWGRAPSPTGKSKRGLTGSPPQSSPPGKVSGSPLPSPCQRAEPSPLAAAPGPSKLPPRRAGAGPRRSPPRPCGAGRYHLTAAPTGSSGPARPRPAAGEAAAASFALLREEPAGQLPSPGSPAASYLARSVRGRRCGLYPAAGLGEAATTARTASTQRPRWRAAKPAPTASDLTAQRPRSTGHVMPGCRSSLGGFLLSAESIAPPAGACWNCPSREAGTAAGAGSAGHSGHSNPQGHLVALVSRGFSFGVSPEEVGEAPDSSLAFLTLAGHSKVCKSQ